jgi:hypothetical protein
LDRSLAAQHRLRLLASIILTALWVSGCARGAGRREPDFSFAMPSGWEIVSTSRLDTTGTGEEEWVILYTFDQPEQRAFAPVRCAVYNISRRESKLPLIYPYQLQAPSWTYLGEGAARTSVKLQDIVTRIQPDSPDTYASTSEIVVQSTSAEGFANRVSIFQWRDNVRSKLKDPNEVVSVPNADGKRGQWYQCVGLFESMFRIDVEQDRVTVWDRIRDRNQLARINIYEPSGGPGGYLTEGGQLVAPVSSCIDFAFGLPSNLAVSPYPEKVVLGFQEQTLVGPTYGSAFLTDKAAQERQSDANWFLFRADLAKVDRVCVSKLAYNPAAESMAETQALEQGTGQIRTVVETEAIYVAGADIRKLRIEWQMLRDADIWRIDGIRSVQAFE